MTESPTTSPTDTEEKFVDATESHMRERFFGAPDIKQKSGAPAPRSKAQSRNCPDDPVPAEKFTSCKMDEPVKLQMSDKGTLALKPLTVMTALQMTVDRYPDNDAFAVKVDGKWKKTKLRDMYRTVRTVAKGFLRLGLTKFHGVGIIGYNAPEWIISYLAAIFAGGVAVGIHYKHTPEACQKVALTVQCNIIVVDSAEDLAKVLQIRNNLPDLNIIVKYGKEEGAPQKIPGVMTWNELLEMGDKASDDRLKESILSLAPNYCCTITFTTGRTGPPKAVMMSHDNVIWCGKVFGKYQSLSSSGGVHVSFLPLSQPTGALLDIYLPLIYATTVYFAPRSLFKHHLVDVIREVRPTFLVATPFFFGQIYDHLLLSLEENAFKKAFITMAMNIGRKAYYNAKEGKPRPCGWWLANQFFLKSIRRQFGLDRCLEVHSAKGFLMDAMSEFFISFGILVLNIYGSSETSGPHSISLPERHRFGACGVEMDGCRTRLVPIEKTVYTEMRVKGRHVFMGYLNEPQMTADAFDEDGWYRSRDIGHKDESGFLWITGCIDELFPLEDGRLISPIPIEKAVKNKLPFTGHCFATGYKRPYVVMLFTLEAATDYETDMPLDVLSKKAEMILRKLNVEISTISKMAANPPGSLVLVIQNVIDEVNKTALDFSTAIRKWKFLPRDFSIPTGELNPTYREKRHVINDIYAMEIDSMFDSPL